MDLSGLFGSYPGMYVVQSFLHLAISAGIINAAIRVWDISNPLITQRFRFLGILFPIFSFPLYQAINPERGSIFFRHASLFDSSRWLHLELWGTTPLGILFILILFLTTVIFILQELIPVVHHTVETRRGVPQRELEYRDDPDVNEILAHLPGEKPEILVTEDDDCIIYSSTGKRAAVFLSSGLMQVLNHEEVQAAVAHEIAHIERSRRPVLFIVFLFRILMFFNPVVLVEFRRAAQEEEKICDDMAVELTGKPHALAATLKKLYRRTEYGKVPEIGEISGLKNSLEEYSHVVHIESRIERLEEGYSRGRGQEWAKFGLTFISIVIINYFIV